jgi:hypothetical protein
VFLNYQKICKDLGNEDWSDTTGISDKIMNINTNIVC